MFNSKSQYGNGRRPAALTILFILVTVITGACTGTLDTNLNNSSTGIQTLSFDSARSFQNDAAYWNSHRCQGQWVSDTYTDVTCEAIAMNFDYCWANQSDDSIYCREFVE